MPFLIAAAVRDDNCRKPRTAARIRWAAVLDRLSGVGVKQPAFVAEPFKVSRDTDSTRESPGKTWKALTLLFLVLEDKFLAVDKGLGGAPMVVPAKLLVCRS